MAEAASTGTEGSHKDERWRTSLKELTAHCTPVSIVPTSQEAFLQAVLPAILGVLMGILDSPASVALQDIRGKPPEQDVWKFLEDQIKAKRPKRKAKPEPEVKDGEEKKTKKRNVKPGQEKGYSGTLWTVLVGCLRLVESKLPTFKEQTLLLFHTVTGIDPQGKGEFEKLIDTNAQRVRKSFQQFLNWHDDEFRYDACEDSAMQWFNDSTPPGFNLQKSRPRATNKVSCPPPATSETTLMIAELQSRCERLPQLSVSVDAQKKVHDHLQAAISELRVAEEALKNPTPEGEEDRLQIRANLGDKEKETILELFSLMVELLTSKHDIAKEKMKTFLIDNFEAGQWVGKPAETDAKRDKRAEQVNKTVDTITAMTPYSPFCITVILFVVRPQLWTASAKEVTLKSIMNHLWRQLNEAEAMVTKNCPQARLFVRVALQYLCCIACGKTAEYKIKCWKKFAEQVGIPCPSRTELKTLELTPEELDDIRNNTDPEHWATDLQPLQSYLVPQQPSTVVHPVTNTPPTTNIPDPAGGPHLNVCPVDTAPPLHDFEDQLSNDIPMRPEPNVEGLYVPDMGSPEFARPLDTLPFGLLPLGAPEPLPVEPLQLDPSLLALDPAVCGSCNIQAGLHQYQYPFPTSVSAPIPTTATSTSSIYTVPADHGGLDLPKPNNIEPELSSLAPPLTSQPDPPLLGPTASGQPQPSRDNVHEGLLPAKKPKLNQ